MRTAFMSIREVIATYIIEDMTLHENSQPGDSGACRRR
jgi:hypothetical protein